MKRILASLIMVAMMLIAIAAPALADVTTDVTVSSGGGEIPIVKCKWEQEPNTVNSTLETGDPTHAINGTQVNPPLVKCAVKPISYYAVVTDEEDGGSVSQVYADVWHPDDSPAPYSTGDDPRGPYFKYEIAFSKLGHTATERALLTTAYDAGLVTFGVGYNLTEAIFEMEKGTADLWMGEEVIDYEQPAGDYKVEVFAVDHQNNQSAVVTNYFEYVAICGIEIDFTSISYGPVNLGIEKMVAGDTNWAAPAAPAGAGQSNLATVRNIGNTWASVVICQDDMGFGKTGTGDEATWNVMFDARMGNDDTYYEQYAPEEEVTLLNALGLSSKDELDFSIKVIKGFGTHSGTMTLGCFTRDFGYDAEAIVGILDPCW